MKTEEEKKKRIRTLVKNITKASNEYYNTSEKSKGVSDKLWDAWFDELKELDPDNSLITGVGAVPVSEWEKVQHEVNLYSLNKVNTEEEFKKWAEECLK